MKQIPEPLRRYVDETGLLLESAGLPRIAGQILGWLLVCEPEHQSLTDLTEALKISKASASTATRMLMQFGFLERTVLPGDRRDYVRVCNDAWKKFFRSRMETMHRMRRNAERGKRLLDGAPPERTARLDRMHRLFTFLERELGCVIERFEAEDSDQGTPAEDFSPAVSAAADEGTPGLARKGWEP
jgi:DNA-binding transcriptional regulator GbsR (MarR family)